MAGSTQRTGEDVIAWLSRHNHIQSRVRAAQWRRLRMALVFNAQRQRHARLLVSSGLLVGDLGGAFIYEYGDHGGLVVMADDVRKTKLAGLPAQRSGSTPPRRSPAANVH